MTITLELPPEIEAKLRESASRQDKEAVRRLLTKAVDTTMEALLRQLSVQLTNDEFEGIADQLADEFVKCVDPNLPPLSDYAVSRESIYEDHP